jgi:hypothetical protein
MPGPAADLARRLARDAEAVCRHYLSNGRRQGRYWVVGDVDNTPGRSLYVRLHGSDSGKGAAGKWTDAATGEHGDLLDLIARNCRLTEVPDVLDEARRFLNQPRPAPAPPLPQTPAGSPDSARRLFAMGRPIRGTLAEVYLRSRGIGDLGDLPALRFHPRCFHRATGNSPCETWPALLAAVTDLDGTITGVHRTWLARDGTGKATLATPRRAMGYLLANGVRFGDVADVLVAGEGIETMLSIRCALLHMPLIAALSANHLAAVILPPTIRRLYVAQDDDAAGRSAAQTLRDRAEKVGIATAVLSPTKNDFNVDLRLLGPVGLSASLRRQLMPEDASRFAAGRS